MTVVWAQHAIFLTRAAMDTGLAVCGVSVLPLAARLSVFAPPQHYDGPLEPVLSERLAPQGVARDARCRLSDIAAFIRACAAADADALELLFADEADWLLDTRSWQRLYALRQSFLTKQAVQSLLARAMEQLTVIKTQRLWSVAPPAQEPARSEFPLSALGEREYAEALVNWRGFRKWETQRSHVPLEQGYDPASAVRLIRLMRLGVMILEGRALSGHASHRAELAGIRDGALSLEALLGLAVQLEQHIHRAALLANLPDDMQHGRVELEQLASELMLGS